ncbi:MAG: sporulation integral membrane protein YtvI [Terrisporobacter sp.]|uniref:sporulation integral membrane protein YtvI n=1 Tax=Terrisporobacter sp. TaxID=1965305 RepID=UPI002FC8F89A
MMLMAVLNKQFLHKLKNNILFFILYTLLFFIICKTFGYIAPFFIGGLLAFIINPLSQKLERKFNINKGISTLFLSFLGVGTVIFIASFLVFQGSQQLVDFLNNLDTNNYSYLNDMITNWMSNVSHYIDYIEGLSNNSINVQELVAKYGQSIANVAKSLLAKTIGLATSIPTIMLLILTLFMSTYFIAKDFDKIGNGFLSIFTDETRIKVRRVKSEAVSSLKGYIKAYAILMSLTFAVIWLSFTLFKVPYGLPLALIGAFLDLIPFLGIIVIFVPVIIYYFVMDNYFISIGITIIFIALSIIRQILEPKLVAQNVGINPLLTIVAIFIGIQVKGVLGIIFFLGLLVMHSILQKVDIL